MYEMEEWYNQSNKKFAWWELLFRVFLGFATISLPVLLVVAYIFFINNKTSIMQFIIGSLVGLSTLPLMLFITRFDKWHKKWWSCLIFSLVIIAIVAFIILI